MSHLSQNKKQLTDTNQLYLFVLTVKMVFVVKFDKTAIKVAQWYDDTSRLLAVQVKLGVSQYLEIVFIVETTLNKFLIIWISLQILVCLCCKIFVEYLLQLHHNWVVNPIVRELVPYQQWHLTRTHQIT